MESADPRRNLIKIARPTQIPEVPSRFRQSNSPQATLSATIHQTVVGEMRGQKPNPSSKNRRVGRIPRQRPKTTVSKTVASDCGPRATAHEAGRRNPCTELLCAPAEGISGSYTPRAQSGFSQAARANPTLRQICASHLPSESILSAKYQ